MPEPYQEATDYVCTVKLLQAVAVLHLPDNNAHTAVSYSKDYEGITPYPGTASLGQQQTFDNSATISTLQLFFNQQRP